MGFTIFLRSVFHCLFAGVLQYGASLSSIICFKALFQFCVQCVVSKLCSTGVFKIVKKHVSLSVLNLIETHCSGLCFVCCHVAASA